MYRTRSVRPQESALRTTRIRYQDRTTALPSRRWRRMETMAVIIPSMTRKMKKTIQNHYGQQHLQLVKREKLLFMLLMEPKAALVKGRKRAFCSFRPAFICSPSQLYHCICRPGACYTEGIRKCAEQTCNYYYTEWFDEKRHEKKCFCISGSQGSK